MRVIAGKAKGRKLKTSIDNEIRPTSDMVKEAIFNIIQSKVYEANVLDLYAGSGALGIEALSRGAVSVYFVDRSNDSMHIIEFNLKQCDFFEQATLYEERAFYAVEKFGKDEKKFDIIFIDPPYSQFDIKILQLIVEYDILDDEGIVIVETDIKQRLDDNIEDKLVCFLARTYGNTKLSLYRKAWNR